MNKRERVIAALNHEQTDVCPFNADFTEQAWDILMKKTNNPNFLAENNAHLHYWQSWNFPEEIIGKQGYFKDGFGVTWNRNGADKSIGISDITIEEPDFDILGKLDWKLNEEKIRKEMNKLISTKEDRFTFGGIGFTMFERLWSLCGMENAMIWMLTDPKFVEALLDKITEHSIKVIKIINEYDIDGFYFGDDWGQQRGLITGKPLWSKMIKPRMAKLYEEARQDGKFILQHSCGDCHEIMPDLIDIGLNCYQTFQPEIYDIANIKEIYGNKLAFWGGISTQQVLPYATPEEVKIEALRIKDILFKNGGYIWAPTHALEFDVPVENVLAMFEIFNDQFKK